MKVTAHIGKKKHIFDLSTNYNQLTYEKFLKLYDAGEDWVKILAVITGIKPDIIRNAKIQNLDTVLDVLGFLKDPVPIELPKKILTYPIPKDLNMESIGQYEDMRNEIKATKTGEDNLKKYPLYCAIYACDPYDWKKAEKMAEEFMQAPAGEVLAVGNFTLLKLIGLKKPTENNSLPGDTLTRKLTQAFNHLSAHLGFTRH